MEKSAKMTFTNVDYIKGTLENMKINVNLNVDKIIEVTSLIDKASRAVIRPITKIKKYFTKELAKYKSKYSDFIEKVSNKITFVNDSIKDKVDGVVAMHLINDELQLNNNILHDHFKLVELLDNSASNISLFNSLFETKEFEQLVNNFNELTKFSNMNGNGTLLDGKNNNVEDTESFEEYSDGENDKKLIGKKTKRKMKELPKNKNGKNKKRKKISKNQTERVYDNDSKQSSGKDSSNSSKASSRFTEATMLEMLQKAYPSSTYVQKLSRTFLSRRLNKKIIYVHKFDYSGDNYSDEKVKTSGESTSYKYAKITFQFITHDSPQVEFTSSLVTNISKYFKASFIQKADDRLIIAGKLSTPLQDILETTFKTNALKQVYSELDSAVIEFYEFYEELASEFNISDPNIRANFDDSTLIRLLDDWKMLTIVREFVKKGKNNNNKAKTN